MTADCQNPHRNSTELVRGHVVLVSPIIVEAKHDSISHGRQLWRSDVTPVGSLSFRVRKKERGTVRERDLVERGVEDEGERGGR